MSGAELVEDDGPAAFPEFVPCGVLTPSLGNVSRWLIYQRGSVFHWRVRMGDLLVTGAEEDAGVALHNLRLAVGMMHPYVVQ